MRCAVIRMLERQFSMLRVASVMIVIKIAIVLVEKGDEIVLMLRFIIMMEQEGQLGHFGQRFVI